MGQWVMRVAQGEKLLSTVGYCMPKFCGSPQDEGLSGHGLMSKYSLNDVNISLARDSTKRDGGYCRKDPEDVTFGREFLVYSESW